MKPLHSLSAMRTALLVFAFAHFAFAANQRIAVLDGPDNISDFSSPRSHSLNLLAEAGPAPEKAKPSPRFKVLLDAGHGGKDLGAQGFFSISEKDISLKLAKMVQRDIERASKIDVELPPMEASLTRDGDSFLTLKDRVNKANSESVELFVSIHANSSIFPKVRGFEVYFLSNEATDEQANKLAKAENASGPVLAGTDLMSIISDVQNNHHINESATFAESVFSSMATRAITQARAVRQGPFTVLHGTTMPAILIEVGYVTNVEDALNLSKDSYLKRLANAISNGIIEFALKKAQTKSPGKINAESFRWPKTERASAAQNHSKLSHASGRQLSY